jgi:ribosome-binding protein aMBF1 (putative translation factor)
MKNYTCYTVYRDQYCGLQILEIAVYTHAQRRADPDVQGLRKAAGAWLRSLREQKGLSQRDLAGQVGADYYTFISQLETGRGRVPHDRYEDWARALDINPRYFVKELMSYYDPITYRILFDGE